MVKNITLFFLLFLSFKNLFSQGGSTYSISGIGHTIHKGGNQSDGMGGVGVSIPNHSYINLLNPAMQGALSRTTISARFSYNGYNIQTEKSSLSEANGTLQNFNLAIPIWKLVVSVGYLPFSEVRYIITQRDDFQLINNNDSTISYRYNYSGLGGLNQIPITVSVTFFDDPIFGALRFGSTFNIFLGSIEREIQNQSLTTTLFSTYTRKTRDQFSGFGATFGIGYTTPPGIFHKNGSFTIGSSIEIPTHLVGNRIKTIDFSTNTQSNSSINPELSGQTFIDTSLSLNNLNTTIPLKFNIGLSYATSNLLLGLDFSYQDWSSTMYFGEIIKSHSSSYRISFGAQYVPDPRLTAGFLLNIGYLLGLYYSKSRFEYNGTPINEIGFTFGFMVPMANSAFSKINISFGYAQRGTLANNLVQEDLFRIRVGLSISEKWFNTRLY